MEESRISESTLIYIFEWLSTLMIKYLSLIRKIIWMKTTVRVIKIKKNNLYKTYKNYIKTHIMWYSNHTIFTCKKYNLYKTYTNIYTNHTILTQIKQY